MSHTENTPLLEVRNLKKYFGKKDRVLHAVDDISVTIQQGKTLGVVGESGCGKSTLGRTVGLAERLYDAYPHELDGGRRQRICIARALAINPKFIVCDEPVSALDVSIQAQILNLLMDLQDEMGLTYMFITHDLSVVKHISSEIMVMYLGRCVEYAPANELFENPVHPYTKALLSAIPIPDISMRGKNIQTIRGEVSSPINPKPGCRFAPRCDFACESCTAADIPLRQCGPNHYVACCCAGE